MRENIYTEINEKAYTKRLANGLRVCVIPKPGFHKAYAMLAVGYGSADARFVSDGKIIEPPKGVAHFLEHKLFEQPDGGNALQVFAGTGASPNAFTSRKMTAYHFSCTEDFKRNLEILLDFVSTPYFTDKNVKKEQGIITQEIGMVNDNPYRCIMDDLFEGLYAVHPVRDSIIGTSESIREITRETLHLCYSKFYIPSNMVLTVAGDVDPQEICDVAEAMLSREYIAPPQRDYGIEPAHVVREYSEKRMEVNLPVFALGFKAGVETCGEQGMRNRMCAELAMEVLAGASSDLYADMYSDGLINKQFGAGVMFFRDTVCTLATGESRDPQGVKRRLVNAAKRMASGGVPDEFERIKRAYCGMNLRALDHFEILCREQAEGIMCGYDFLKSFGYCEAIQWEDVRDILEKLICEDSMAMTVVLPK